MMEAPCALKMHGKDTEPAYGEENGPPTSMTLWGPESYSQIAFTNIQMSYPPRTDIKCTFRKRKKFKSGSKDWVGIFKVGWQNTKEYYTWISVSSSAENEVLFKAYYLPKDDEYYQFCYVDQNGEVRGVSTPFQFKVDDENEIVIVTTQEEMENLNEENTVLKKENQDLTEMIESLRSQLQTATEKNNTLEKENTDQVKMVQTLQAELNSAAVRNDTLKTKNLKENQDLTEEIETLRSQLQTATQKNNTLEKENMDQVKMVQTLKAELNSATVRNDTLKKENLEFQDQVKTLVEEKELMKKDNLELKLQAMKVPELLQKTMDQKKIEAENKQLQMENEAKKQAVMNLSGVLESYKEEVTQQKHKLEVQKSLLEKENSLKEELQQSLENEKRKWLDSEDKIQELEKDLRSVQTNKLMMEQKLAKEQDDNMKMKDRIAVLQSTVELREEEIRDLNAAYMKKRDEVDELNNQLIQAQFSSTPQIPSLAYGNPYQDNPSRITAENELSVQFEARPEETCTPTLRTCPVCSEKFHDVTDQVFEDHMICHDLEESNSGQSSNWPALENVW